MEPMLAAFEQVASEIAYSFPRIDFISDLTGQLVKEEVTTPEYWRNHLRQPLRFAAGMQALHQRGYGIFVEIGPESDPVGDGPPLCAGRSMVAESEAGTAGLETASTKPGDALYQGAAVDWPGFDRDYSRRRVPLPTYPFQRKRYWLENARPDQPEKLLDAAPAAREENLVYEVEWRPQARPGAPGAARLSPVRRRDPAPSPAPVRPIDGAPRIRVSTGRA